MRTLYNYLIAFWRSFTRHETPPMTDDQLDALALAYTDSSFGSPPGHPRFNIPVTYEDTGEPDTDHTTDDDTHTRTPQRGGDTTSGGTTPPLARRSHLRDLPQRVALA